MAFIATYFCVTFNRSYSFSSLAKFSSEACSVFGPCVRATIATRPQRWLCSNILPIFESSTPSAPGSCSGTPSCPSRIFNSRRNPASHDDTCPNDVNLYGVAFQRAFNTLNINHPSPSSSLSPTTASPSFVSLCIVDTTNASAHPCLHGHVQQRSAAFSTEYLS